MKTLFKLFTLSVCICAVSCINQDKLPKSTIKELVTEGLNKGNLLNQYATIEVGYYEENDEDRRYVLRKLAASGVITYKVERVESKVKIKDGYTYDYNTYRIVDNYKTVTRYKYFVETALTAKGDSLAVVSIPLYVDEPDEYLMPLKFEVYPEDAVSREEVFGDDGQLVEKEKQEVVQEVEQVSEKSEPKTAYEKAKAKEHKETKYVKSHSLKVTDARNIFVREGIGQADVIVDSYDVSPFGRILKYEREGAHEIYEVSFIYYQDKGWVITKMED